MCGIVGVVGKVWQKEESAFKTLLELDTIRGPHSTGVVAASLNGWEYIKSTGTPWELYGMKGFDAMMRRYHRVLIGHNRWATVGKITNDNAHPFVHGDFIGVHNGTLKSMYNLPGDGKFETDSETIYHSFSKDGVEPTLAKLNGAFALAWFNSKDNVVQLCRNNERPLWLCRTADGESFFFASEPWMLRVALNRNQISGGEPIPIEPGVLVSISIEKKGIEDPILPHIKKVALYTKPPEKEKSNKTTNRCSDRSLLNPSKEPAKEEGGVVVPFRQPEGQAPSLKDFLGKTVTLAVVGRDCVNKTDFISCCVEYPDTNGHDVEIRVFSSPETKIGKWLLESVNYFQAKVKKATHDAKNGNYLTIDVRTLAEVKPPPGAKTANELLKAIAESDEARIGEERLVVYGGKEVELAEWYEMTAEGCAWCQASSKPSENGDYHWYEPRSYVCKKCKDDPEVSQFLRT